MTNNENKLINMIRATNNPDKALTIAVSVILSYLKEQPLSFQEQEPVAPVEHA